MARDWYTPEELRDLQALNPCPPWQRMNNTGWCVERWWAGGPMSVVMNGIVLAGSMVVLGTVLVYASKVELLKPAMSFFKKSREHVKSFSANKGRRRTRRARRCRRY